MDNKQLIKDVGAYCKEYRENTLQVSLTDFSKELGVNLKNINAFEYGRANNIVYLSYYYNYSKDYDFDGFVNGLFNVIRRSN